MDSKQRPQEFSSTVEQLGVHLRRLEPENSCSRCSKCGLFQTQHRNGRWTKTIQDYPRLLGLLVLDNLHRRTESPKDLAVTQLKKCRAPHTPRIAMLCAPLFPILSILILSFLVLLPLCHRFAMLRTLESTLTLRSFEVSMLLLLPLLSGNSDSSMMRSVKFRKKKNHVTEGRIRPLLALCSNFETRLSLKPFQILPTALLGLWLLDLRSKAQYTTPLWSVWSVWSVSSAEELVSSKLWLDLESLSRAFRIEHCEHRIEHRLPPLDFDAVLSRRA